MLSQPPFGMPFQFLNSNMCCLRKHLSFIGLFLQHKFPSLSLFDRFYVIQNGCNIRKYASTNLNRSILYKLNRRTISSKKMSEVSNYSDIFANEVRSERKFSTYENLQTALLLLKEIIEYRNNNVSSWIIESKVKKLCGLYKSFLQIHKSEFIQVLAKEYSVNHKEIYQSALFLVNLTQNEPDSYAKIIKNEDQLKNILNPQYSWLFVLIGKLEKGVKFLVDLRTDVLDLIAEQNAKGQNTVQIQRLNVSLKDLLSLWFSIGFLQLERVTWHSSCEMLQKISEYEAVHPMRSWTDLKRRVGPYRRCFIFLHGSMPSEPIVVLHTALCDEISSSMEGIVTARSRMTLGANSHAKEELVDPEEEDPTNIKAAVFYSISSTQRGLQGIELGNYLIKSVVHKLQNEFPQMTQFSSLSPIPNFKIWLLDKLKSAEKGVNDILYPEELSDLKNHIKPLDLDFWKYFRKIVQTNSWVDDIKLITILEKPFMRLCSRYLFVEKRRGYALDSVANFHLRNGAVMWRLNWLADLSPRGLSNSCSIMVNYRYFLEDTEFNSRTYIERQVIPASEKILKIVDQAQQLILVSKI